VAKSFIVGSEIFHLITCYEEKSMEYPFRVLEVGSAALAQRPFSIHNRSFSANAARFVPGAVLEEAIHIAIALGAPLFLTGAAGCGKTQCAYYVAHRLSLGEVLHFQCRSDTRARDLLYDFERERWQQAQAHSATSVNKATYLSPRPLWQALASKTPRVLLIDEIDKAPRDFANDLLLELEKMEFAIPELGKTFSAPPARRPLVFITSNNERILPDPFLRRCVYHHIEFDEELLQTVLNQHCEDFAALDADFLERARERFLSLRRLALRKPPALAELLMWLRVLSVAQGEYAAYLDTDLSKLPFLGVLIKDHEDLRELATLTE
jgi:MoxR-like ATPase